MFYLIYLINVNGLVNYNMNKFIYIGLTIVFILFFINLVSTNIKSL